MSNEIWRPVVRRGAFNVEASFERDEASLGKHRIRGNVAGTQGRTIQITDRGRRASKGHRRGLSDGAAGFHKLFGDLHAGAQGPHTDPQRVHWLVQRLLYRLADAKGLCTLRCILLMYRHLSYSLFFLSCRAIPVSSKTSHLSAAM